MRKILIAAALVFAATAVPARASSITIDSINCNSDGGCYGLSWKLTIDELAAPVIWDGVSYQYSAKLEVTDDTNVSGTPTVVISAVDFKVSTGVSGAALYTTPSSSSGWSTAINQLNSGGCGSNPNPGFVCSETSTNPANFTGSNIAQTWAWYFNTSAPIFADLEGAHIGAKMTDLSTKGRLLSASYVPEPGTLGLFVTGLAAIVVRARRRQATIQ